jgi:hypothetical protein
MRAGPRRPGKMRPDRMPVDKMAVGAAVGVRVVAGAGVDSEEGWAAAWRGQ